MTTNLFAIVNVKQLLTYVVLEFYCLFFPNILVCWRPKFRNFLNSFHNRVEFGTIFWRAFGISGGGGFEHRNPTPPGYATVQERLFRLNVTVQIGKGIFGVTKLRLSLVSRAKMI